MRFCIRLCVMLTVLLFIPCTVRAEDELLDNLETQEIQGILDELLGESSFSFSDTLRELTRGGRPFEEESIQKVFEKLLLGELGSSRRIFEQILFLAFAGAVLNGFVQLFEDDRLGDICFYMICLIIHALLLKNFVSISETLKESLTDLVSFMQAVVPSYYLVITAASGAATAALFYQIVLLVIFCVEYLLVMVLIPAVRIYVLLEFINLLTKEGALTKAAELLRESILWVQRSMVTVIVGMQVIQGLIAPAIDSLRRSTIGKTVSAIPGAGGAINAVTEIVLASAVLIRNCFGAVVLLALILMGAAPLVHLGVLSFLYKLTGALIQPICDLRLVSCVQTMGEGCMMLLRILLASEILFMLTIVILAGTLS